VHKGALLFRFADDQNVHPALPVLLFECSAFCHARAKFDTLAFKFQAGTAWRAKL